MTVRFDDYRNVYAAATAGVPTIRDNLALVGQAAPPEPKRLL
jgi:hypothetical protein